MASMSTILGDLECIERDHVITVDFTGAEFGIIMAALRDQLQREQAAASPSRSREPATQVNGQGSAGAVASHQPSLGSSEPK